MPSDHDLLVEVHTIVARLDKTVNGNGRPGLLQDHAALKADHMSLADEVHEIRRLAPSRKEKAGYLVGLGGTLITAVGAVIVALVSGGN